MADGYSRTQIGLHWGIALLIGFQLIFGDDMSHAWRSFTRGNPVDMTVLVWAHIVIGVLVLGLVIWRLIVRLRRGAPDAPDTGVPMLNSAGEWAHWLLYGLMVLIPVSGLIGWYGSLSWMVEVHGWLKPVLIVLVGLHVLAAFWHQFIRKDRLLLRMMKAGD